MYILRCQDFQSSRTLKSVHHKVHDLGIPPPRDGKKENVRPTCAGSRDGFIHATSFFNIRRLRACCNGGHDEGCSAGIREVERRLFYHNGVALGASELCAVTVQYYVYPRLKASHSQLAWTFVKARACSGGRQATRLMNNQYQISPIDNIIFQTSHQCSTSLLF